MFSHRSGKQYPYIELERAEAIMTCYLYSWSVYLYCLYHSFKVEPKSLTLIYWLWEVVSVPILLDRAILNSWFGYCILGVQYEMKNQKTFLRRVAYPALSLEQLYIGSTILVYSRQLFIEDYGDDFTRKHLRGLQET